MDLDMIVTCLFSGDRWHAFHDAVLNSSGISHSKEELRELFLTLPMNIQMTAFEWGLGDTVFRDEVYEHITEEIKGGFK